MARQKERLGNVEISSSIDLDGMLGKLPIELRSKALRKAVAAAAKIVADDYKRRVPRGATGNLRKSITTKVKSYRDGRMWIGLAGARKPTGSHAHLIDQGHKIGRRGKIGDSAKGKGLEPLTGNSYVGGTFDLKAAIDTTAPQQDAAVIKSIVDSIKKAGG